MDFASLIGLALALAGLFVGHTLDGGRFASLFQPAAFAIVVVGTFGAVLLQSEARSFRRGMRIDEVDLAIARLEDAVSAFDPAITRVYFEAAALRSACR